MRLPTIGGDATIRTNISVKTKWDIIHTAMLMLNTEEVFDEKFAQQVLEFFLYLHMKYCDKVCTALVQYCYTNTLSTAD